MHDHRTRTVEGAAAAEYLRAGGGHREAPDPADYAGADIRAEMKAQRERDDAARARGEYVPSDAMRTAASGLSLALAQAGMPSLTVYIEREGFLTVHPDRSGRTPTIPAQAVIETVQRFYADAGADVDVDLSNGRIWVRINATASADPFVVDGVAVDNPPYL